MFFLFDRGGQQGEQVWRGLEVNGEGNQGGQWRRCMLMRTPQTHNEQERRRGDRAEQGVC